MYEYIEGTLTTRRPDRVVVDVGGVGWRILVPLGTYEALPPRDGARVRLLVVHHLREDREALYGFATEDERAYFELLLGVAGVGPTLALGVVSALPPGAFRAAVLAGDAATLSRVRGIGKKLAGRLLVELAEKVADMAPAGGATPRATLAPPAADAVLALVALGLDRRDAEARAAEALRDLGAGAVAGDVVREVLRRSAR